MSRTLQFAIAFGLLVVVVAALLITGLMQTLVVVPVLAVLWSLDQIFQAMPQPIMWAVLVVAIGLIALRSLPALFPAGSGDPEPPTFDEGKVSRLTRWFQNASEGEYFRKRLLRDLLAVALATKGHEKTINEAQIAQLLRSEELGLPEDVRLYLLGALRGGPAEKPSGSGGAFFASTTPASRKNVYQSQEILDLIAYLENELEIHHHER